MPTNASSIKEQSQLPWSNVYALQINHRAGLNNYEETPITHRRERGEWWLTKIKETHKRDLEKEIELNVLGWKVLTIWECELKHQLSRTLYIFF